jgi:hypothetical protein
MEYVSTAALTILFTAGFLIVYKFVINPQIVLRMDPTKMAKCPDSWTYDSNSNLCKPNASTSCMPFDPNASTIQSAVAKCNLARTCGTTWSGMCG